MKRLVRIGIIVLPFVGILYVGTRLPGSHRSDPKTESHVVSESIGANLPVKGKAARGTLATPGSCKQPLLLSIGQVDPQFSVNRQTLEAAVQHAVQEWNSATGRRWFRLVDSGGIGINLLFDGRQETLDQQRQEQQRIKDEVDALHRMQRNLEDEARRIRAFVTEWEAADRGYEARVLSHNEQITRWSQNGAAEPDVIAVLEQEGQELSRIRETLEQSRLKLQRDADLNQEALSRTQNEAAVVSSHVEDFKRSFPPIPFREAEHVQGAFVNEINIYAVTDPQDFHRALLHEMGHAMGLQHSAERDAIMTAAHEMGSGTVHLTGSDIAAALALCSAQ